MIREDSSLPIWSGNRDTFELWERSQIAKMLIDRFGIEQNTFVNYSFSNEHKISGLLAMQSSPNLAIRQGALE